MIGRVVERDFHHRIRHVHVGESIVWPALTRDFEGFMKAWRGARKAWASMSWLARTQVVCGLILVLTTLALLFTRGFVEFERRANAKSARELISAGKFEEAGRPLTNWLKTEPDSAEARFLAARRAFGLQRFDVGIIELDAAQKLGYPQNSVARERGIILAMLGRLTEAEPILRPLFQARAGDHSVDPDLDEALAKCYIENFQLRAAEDVVNRWIIDAPTSAKANYWKADLKRRKSGVELPALIRDFEHVLELDGNHDRARIALAELYLKVHRNADAEREYVAYQQRHPDNIDAWLGLGQIAAENGQIARAIELLDRATALAPNDSRPLVARGKIESRRGSLELALKFLDKAVVVDNIEPEVRYQRSLILSRLGRTDDARKEQDETSRLRKEKEELDELLQGLLTFPADTERQIRASRWFFDHGHPEEGARWAEKILREHAHHVEANRLLADHYERQGKTGLANFYRLQGGGR
jgi:tetratricopeptide (TPR) repeat protein